MERMDKEGFERLKADLELTFSAPESTYTTLTVADVINRNQAVVIK